MGEHLRSRRGMKLWVTVLVVVTLSVGQSGAQFIPIFDWVRSFFGSYSQPSYTSIQNISNEVEERIYPPTQWACSELFLTPETKDAKTSEMFMTLLRYIQGRNDQNQKIEMTIPLIIKVDHRNGKLWSYEMCVFIPSEYQTLQKSAPHPTDNRVKIVAYPQLRLYSKLYGGYTSQAVEKDQVAELSQVLKNSSIPYFEERDMERATYFVAAYDSPTKFWFRRNEVWLLASDTPKSINNHFTRQGGGGGGGDEGQQQEEGTPQQISF